MLSSLKTCKGSLGKSQGEKKCNKKKSEKMKRKESESVKVGARWNPQGGCVLMFEHFKSYP